MAWDYKAIISEGESFQVIAVEEKRRDQKTIQQVAQRQYMVSDILALLFLFFR